MTQSFGGNKLTFVPTGCTTIRFKDTGDNFIVKRPTTYARNILIGSMYIDTAGEMTIENTWNGDRAVIEMKSSRGKGAHGVVGSVNKMHRVFGQYNKAIYY